MATSLPQAAPVSKVGMNNPFDDASPNVHAASKKYVITNTAKEMALCVSGGS